MHYVWCFFSYPTLMTLWARCYFHYSHFTGEKNGDLGRWSKLLKALLWVKGGARTMSRAWLLTARSAAYITHSIIMKTQRNGDPSKYFLFRKHSLGHYTGGSPGGFKSLSMAINQEWQIAYCTPDFFNLQAPNKCLVMELEDNKIKTKSWEIIWITP